MCSNSRNVGVIVLEDKKDSIIAKSYLSLLESMARLFASSMVLQGEIDSTNRLIEDTNSFESDLKHARAELTASIAGFASVLTETSGWVFTGNSFAFARARKLFSTARLIFWECNNLDVLAWRRTLSNASLIVLCNFRSAVAHLPKRLWRTTPRRATRKFLATATDFWRRFVRLRLSFFRKGALRNDCKRSNELPRRRFEACRRSR